MSRIAAFLARRFPQQSVWQRHFGELLSAYQSSGLADQHLVTEVTSGDDGKLCARVWEAMLYRYLSSLGFEFRKTHMPKSGNPGPDFCVVRKGQTIWIEAVTPASEGIPKGWLSPPKRGECKVRTKPDQEMLLRWTSVLKDKRDKLKSYVERNIVDQNDCTVIAINSCRLSDFARDDLGVSRLPFAVEAVFPVGPLAVPITQEGQPAGEPGNIPRHTVKKPNEKDIPTGNFLDHGYANVSAIIGCYQKDMVNGDLLLTVVHNPLARVPLPRGLFGANREYVADDAGDHYIVRLLSDTSGLRGTACRRD
jgi:type I restriction enzyme S subunit